MSVNVNVTGGISWLDRRSCVAFTRDGSHVIWAAGSSVHVSPTNGEADTTIRVAFDVRGVDRCGTQYAVVVGVDAAGQGKLATIDLAEGPIVIGELDVDYFEPIRVIGHGTTNLVAVGPWDVHAWEPERNDDEPVPGMALVQVPEGLVIGGLGPIESPASLPTARWFGDDIALIGAAGLERWDPRTSTLSEETEHGLDATGIITVDPFEGVNGMPPCIEGTDLSMHGDLLYDFAISAQRRVAIVVRQRDGVLQQAAAVDLARPDQAATLPGLTSGVAISPDGEHVAAVVVGPTKGGALLIDFV